MQNKPGVYVEIPIVAKAPPSRGDLVEIGNADQAGELYGKDSLVHAWMKRREQAIDAMHALAPSLRPRERERDIFREQVSAASYAMVVDVELLHMSRARLREQVASGGVDCKETRKVNLRRVKAEHRAVVAMQDAVRMVASWSSKRERCAFCAGPKERGYATCSYCGHGLKLRMLGAERDGGIATLLTPGPHECATAWASATWEEL